MSLLLLFAGTGTVAPVVAEVVAERATFTEHNHAVWDENNGGRMSGALALTVGAERPTWNLFWVNQQTAVDLSSGWTFVVDLLAPGASTYRTLSATVTANPTPTVDTGDPDDTPTLEVDIDAGELDGIATGRAKVKVTATSGGKDRVGFWRAVVNA